MAKIQHAPLALPTLGKKPKRNYRLEVFPQWHGSGIEDVHYQVRLVSPNGRTIMYSGSEGYNKSRAIRSARRTNHAVAYDWLDIHVLDADGNIERVIEGKI